MSRSPSNRKADCHPERKYRARGLCNNCYQRAQYNVHRERRLADGKRYYAEHKTSRLASNERMRERGYFAKYYLENRTKIIQTIKDWAIANPDKARAQRQRRRASANGAIVPGRVPDAAELAALTARGVRCAYCRRCQANTIDHIVPISRGGLHTIDNLIGACRGCNSAKGAKLLNTEWQAPSRLCP